MGPEGAGAVISSPHNPRVKQLRRLRERRHRVRTGLTFVEGWRALDGAWRARARFRSLWLAEDARPPAPMAALLDRLASVPRFLVSRAVFDTLADTATPQGVIAVLEMTPASLSDLIQANGNPFLLILDGLQDPGNAGALVRTAVATGVCGIVTTPGTVDLFSPRALRGAAGLTPACPVAPDVAPEVLGRTLQDAGIVLSILDVGGTRSPFEADWRGARALAVGSEAAGPGPVLQELAAERLRIPMRPPAESLNAAVSAALVLYEAARQRGSLPEVGPPRGPVPQGAEGGQQGGMAAQAGPEG